MDEPQDGTIVGWGNPVRGVCVRVDAWTDSEDDPRVRWFPTDEDSKYYPSTWEVLLDHIKWCGHEPYILEVKNGPQDQTR